MRAGRAAAAAFTVDFFLLSRDMWKSFSAVGRLFPQEAEGTRRPIMLQCTPEPAAGSRQSTVRLPERPPWQSWVILIIEFARLPRSRSGGERKASDRGRGGRLPLLRL